MQNKISLCLEIGYILLICSKLWKDLTRQQTTQTLNLHSLDLWVSSWFKLPILQTIIWMNLWTCIAKLFCKIEKNLCMKLILILTDLCYSLNLRRFSKLCILIRNRINVMMKIRRRILSFAYRSYFQAANQPRVKQLNKTS